MQAKDWRFSFGAAGARARVPLDHALRSQVAFDTVAHSQDITIILRRNENTQVQR